MPTPTPDHRVAAFCSPQSPDVFNSVVVATQIWKEDPFDVESIHQTARDTFNSMLNQATISQVPGRILTVIGESGAGKTHLMRYFRNYVHRRDFGYFGYLQLTSPEQDYARFILGHLIDSLNQPYDRSSDTTGLMRLSNAVAESSKTLGNTAIRSGTRRGTVLAALREWDLSEKDLGELVRLAIRRIVRDPNFMGIDNNVLATMLYLQAQDSFIKNLVITYLRSQPLPLFTKTQFPRWPR